MSAKFQTLENGNLKALVFLRDDAPGQKCLLAGILALGRSGDWATSDSTTYKGSGLHQRALPYDTTEKAAVDAMLTDVGIEPCKCQSFRYE
jgi:hypothetical protein